MLRTRIKFCGITRVEDAYAAADAGADAVGLVFHAPSVRNVGLRQAQAVVAALPPFVSVVGVFVDPDDDELNRVLDSVRLDVVQFHGDESPARCRRCPLPFVKAIRMREGISLPAEARRFAGSAALLLDTYVPNVTGGTGESFAWDRVPKTLGVPIILAGGLTADNVGDALAAVAPFAVDVSSGVERRGGIKDAVKMRRFMAAVQTSDARRNTAQRAASVV